MTATPDRNGKTAIAYFDRLAVEIIRRSDVRRIVVLPHRRVVEPTVAWIDRCRRLPINQNASIPSTEAPLQTISTGQTKRRPVCTDLPDVVAQRRQA